MKKDLQLFLGILNYPSNFHQQLQGCVSHYASCPQWKQTGHVTEYTKIYMRKQKQYTKEMLCVKFCDVARPLYLETDTSAISLGAGLLQLRDSMNCAWDKIPDNAILWAIAFVSSSLSSVKQCYGNVQHKALGILHGLEKFHHYYFTRKFVPSMIMSN